MAVSEPPGPPERLFASPLGPMLLRPWFDRMGLRLVADHFLPLGAAWAAAELAGEDMDRLARLSGWRGAAPERLRAAAQRCARARAQRDAADGAWRDALFNGAAPERAGALEDRRRRAAEAYLTARFAFLRAHRAARFDSLRFTVAAPDAVAARHGARLAAPETAFPLSDPARGAETRPARRRAGMATWLRWPATVGGAEDEAWARVSTGDGRMGRRPVLILAHGVGMEVDHWSRFVSPHRRLLARGWAVIEPEGPDHGRRRPPGRQAGEGPLGGGPMGLLDYMAAHVGELGGLIRWARARFGGPVALGGVSLGALTAARALTAAANWPEEARPDAAILSTVTGDLATIDEDSAFLSRLGAPAAFRAAGWRPEDFARWTPLLEAGASAVPPERVIAIVGEADRVLPTAGGMALARRWALPPENLFTPARGHFTASFGMTRDPAPLDRLAEIMDAARPRA